MFSTNIIIYRHKFHCFRKSCVFNKITTDTINSVKLNSLDLHCCHRATYYNKVWGRGSYITLFSTSFHSKRFPVTSLRSTEYLNIIIFNSIISRISQVYYLVDSPCLPCMVGVLIVSAVWYLSRGILALTARRSTLDVRISRL